MSDPLQKHDAARTQAKVAPQLTCEKCGRQLPFFAPVCEYCTPILAAHSTIDPNDPCKLIAAEGQFYRDASENPDRPIVVIGMWLLWAPVLIVALIADIGFLFALPDFIRNPPPADDLAIICIGLVVLASWTYISAKLLFKTTDNVARRKRNVAEQDAAPDRGGE